MPPPRHKQDEPFDNEKAQAVVRIIIISCTTTYCLLLKFIGLLPPEGYIVPYIMLSSLLLAFFYYGWVKRRPGKIILRRVITMSNDMGAMTWTMAAGGEAMLPIYAILMWVTVGNSLRHGTTYLKITTAVALASIAVTTTFNAYWRDNPFLVLTLACTTILVPAYIHSLLQRLHTAYAREQEANLSKSRFLAQASHDLRQPIHAISLFTACLRSAKLGAEELRMVENIDRSLQSVSRLFKSLLDISTLDSGKVEPRYEPVAIGEILEDVQRQNSEAALRDGTALRIRACAVGVRTDRALLTTMVQNIVNNAIKYAPGRPILIACRRQGDRLAIQVYDRGPGITDADQAKVFDEFYRVRRRGDKDIEGVGLGPPIVRRLGALLGLEVTLRSVPGQGTCVSIGNLPIVQAQALAAPPRALDPPSALGGLRVLLVEDDEAVLRATASLLQAWGCRVQAEPAIPDAVAEVDLLVTDFDLGNGVTGTDCIAAVRRLTGQALPAVVMTGHDEARVREDLGTADVPILSKPIRPAELRSVLVAARIGMRPRPAPAG